MELFLLNYGIKPIFYESEYNRYYEEIIFANPKLEDFHPDLFIFCTSNRNISQYPNIADTDVSVNQKLDSEYGKYVSMWKHASETYRCPIIQNNFELPYFRLMGNKDTSDFHGRVNFITRLNMRFYEYAQEHKDFYIHDIHYESAVYGLDKWSDPFYWYMYKYAMAVPAIPYYAFNLANIVKSIYGKNKKVISVDLDNTLWGGIVGDDGAENIEIGQETPIGQAYSEFQAYLRQCRQLGVLLTINSKNDYENALSGLKRPDSLLNEEDFVSIKANWNPKSQNLLETAEELKLLPESFVFMDDNPAEREIIRKQIPDVAVPEIKQPEHYIKEIDRSGFFEVTNFSHDDLTRNEMYQENMMRKRAEMTFSNYEDYLISLEMQGEIGSFTPEYMSRIAQLTNKSNQFNLTTRRYSQSEIEEIAANKDYMTLYGKLSDKFGDNGVVSIVIGKKEDLELHIELWLMSCRVLKRGMEYAMMDELVRKCQAEKIKKIVGYYYPTKKNEMVKDFYGLQGFQKVKEDENGNAAWELVIEGGYQNKNTTINVSAKERGEL